MGWTVQGSSPPGGLRFSAPIHSKLTVGTMSFLGIKWLGPGINHPPPSSTAVKGSIALYLCSPSVPSWEVMGWTLPFYYNVAGCISAPSELREFILLHCHCPWKPSCNTCSSLTSVVVYICSYMGLLLKRKKNYLPLKCILHVTVFHYTGTVKQICKN
jgi:hypothetical protein